MKSDKAFDIADIYSTIRDKGALKADGYELRSISKVSTGDETKVQYKGTVTYTSKKPEEWSLSVQKSEMCRLL